MNQTLPAKIIFSVSLVLSVLFILFKNELYAFSLFFPILAYYLIFFKQKISICLTVLLIIAFTRLGFSELRDVITYSMILGLLVIFIKEFGLNFNLYPSIPKPVIIFIGLLFLAMAISCSFSRMPLVSIIPFIRTIIFFIICYLLFSFIKNISYIYLYLYVIFLAQLAVGLSIYFEFIKSGFNFFLENGGLARYSGIIDNPNVVGLLIIITTNIIIGLLFTDSFKTVRKKWFLFFLLFNNLLITIFTDSRAAIIAMAFDGFLLLFLFNKKLLLKIIISTALAILLMFSIPPINDFVNILLRIEGYSIRPYLWEAGYKVFINNFFTGVGPGLYGNYCFIYLPSGMVQFFNNMGFLDPGLDIKQTPHNFILYIASENGILGLISVIYLYFLYFYLNIKSILYYKQRNKDIYILSISFFATGIGVFWRSFFEVSGIMNYGFLSQDLPFWLIMIIIIYLYYNREEIIKTGITPFFSYNKTRND